jgi:hypothetical protein
MAVTSQEFNIPIDEISRFAANFTIGFARISVNNKTEDAGSAGSGSLISVGSVKGILTAAHVLEALPDEGNVGIIMHQPSAKPVIDMSLAQKLKIGGEASGVSGPDLGFLWLPLPTATALEARLSVYSLSRRREDALANAVPAPTSIDAIVGIISELTEDVPSGRKTVRKKAFKAIFGPGCSSSLTETGEHDYFDFEVKSAPGFTLPNSFKGTSGGAVWRFYMEKKDGAVSVVNSRLVGVPFFETLRDGKVIVSCHGLKSIYSVLLNEIRKKWPDAPDRIVSAKGGDGV